VTFNIALLKSNIEIRSLSMMVQVLTEKIMDILPRRLHGTLDYITSPGIIIPVFVLLVLVIYYLVSLTGLLRESNEDLKEQVRLG
jgi:hypothetical protein